MNYSLKRWPFFKVYLIFRLLLFLFFQLKYIKPRHKKVNNTNTIQSSMNTHTTEFSLNVNVSLWIVKDISEFRPMIKLWFTYRNEYFLQNGYRIIAARTRPLDGIYIGTNAFFSMWPFISTSSKVGSFDNRKAPCNRGKVNCSTKIRFLAHDSVEHPRLALPDGKMLYFCRMLILLHAV